MDLQQTLFDAWHLVWHYRPYRQDRQTGFSAFLSCVSYSLHNKTALSNLCHSKMNFAKQPVKWCTNTIQLNKSSLSWLYWEALFLLFSFHYMAPDVSIAVFFVSSCLHWCLTPCGCLWWTCWSAESWKHKLTCVSRLPFGPLILPILVWKDGALVSH